MVMEVVVVMVKTVGGHCRRSSEAFELGALELRYYDRS